MHLVERSRQLRESMSRSRGRFARGLAGLGLSVLAGCSHAPALPPAATIGPTPTLPAPRSTLIPTVNVAPARAWSPGAMPVAAAGLTVNAFASGLEHPRWLTVLPNGDVLVAETNAPDRPLRKELLGIKGWIMSLVMRRAGAAVPSANRITLLRDADGDGEAETRSVFLEGLNSPFGMALVDDTLYIANTDAIVYVPCTPGALRAAGPPTVLTSLPGGPLNHHWTKGLIASTDGRTLYVSVGSNSNVAEHGLAHEAGRARIWQIDRASGASRPYADGLRNPVGMAWRGNTLWTVVNERDEIGPDLVPDYLTSVQPGGFYGWPFSYYGQHVDARVSPTPTDKVASAIVPDYALGAHTASLGLVPSAGSMLEDTFGDGMFVGQHGSWNRRPRSGYKVIFVPFRHDKPSGEPRDVLTGFVTADGDANGRPVGVAVDHRGALLVADDVGNIVWRVTRGR